MDTPPTDPLLGRLVDKRYLIESKVARGGMATVYQAMDLRLERPVYKQLQTGVREKEKVETKGESVTKSRR